MKATNDRAEHGGKTCGICCKSVQGGAEGTVQGKAEKK